ncbi:MAG: zinc-dependent metalloprotease, partial [Gemmatimonadota bacterium]
LCALWALPLLAGCGLRSTPEEPPNPEPAAQPDEPEEVEEGERPERPARRGARDESDLKPYDSVVTAEARTREGLFKVHMVDDDLYFEIPEGELGRDMLLLGRVEEGVGLGGFASGRVAQRIVRWERADDRIHLRGVSYSAMADEDRAIRRAVDALTRGPIIRSFDVETFGPDSAAVIEVSGLYTGNVPEMSPLRGVQNDRSFVEWFTAFPGNVEVRATQTGVAPPSGSPGGTPPVTSTRTTHWSMVRLPEEPMMPRLHDRRVGFISYSTVDYGRPEHRAEERRFIRRHRLEKADPSAELSDPVEPIVYWIDPATPEWLVPWVKSGVAQWLDAFQEAGFTNAIEAREAPSPEEDPDWSIHDARHSMIYWRPSDVANATGGAVVDPRTGEIIKGEVNMFHNVMNLLRNWYFVQVAPLDERAHALPLPDSLMGRLVEYVVAHEVGHAIGFPHNFKASAMYPADSLRSREFLERQGGHVATLMDYSRFNYVAQPEDDIPPELLVPRVGPYDRFAVKWGYSPIPEAGTPDEERPVLDEWARMQDTIPWYRFTTPDATNDPHAVTEAVGNGDAVYSSTLAMRNLERVVDLLLPASERPGEDYTLLEELYGNVVGQWGRYMGHVTAVVGGAYTQEKYGTGERFEPVPRDEQREALEFLTENAFHVPEMLLRPEILRRIESEGAVQRIGTQQGRVLSQLLSSSRLDRLVEYEALSNGTTAYTVADLMDDLRTGVWAELDDARVQIDVYRRNLQREYLAAAGRYLAPGGSGDARPFMRAELRDLSETVAVARGRAADGMTRLHLADVEAEIERILDPRAELAGPAAGAGGPAIITLPLPFDPAGWMETQGLEHPEGWQGLVRDLGIQESRASEGWVWVDGSRTPSAPGAAHEPGCR